MTQPSIPPSPKLDERSLRQRLSAFRQSHRSRSIFQLLNSLLPYAALWVLAYYALAYSIWLVLPISIIAAGFLVRIFIIFHDCGH